MPSSFVHMASQTPTLIGTVYCTVFSGKTYVVCSCRHLNQLNIRIVYARRYSLGSEQSPYVHSKHVSRKLHIQIYLPHLS